MGENAYILPVMDSAAVQPTIIVDSREQQPLTFTRLKSQVGTLQSGDYSILGCEELFGIERKSIPDLVQCCTGSNRERFERELHRLRGFRFKRLLIIGSKVEIETGRYRSGISPRSILATVASFECRYDLPVLWIPSPDDAAQQVEAWAYWYFRELVKTVSTIVDKPKDKNETKKQLAAVE